MTNPKPLSNDWLYWNPETIHNYPEPGDTGEELSELTVVPERNTGVKQPSRPQARVMARESLHDLATAVVTSLVAAILVALLMVLLS